MNFKETRILGNIVDPQFDDDYRGAGSFKILPKIVSDGRLDITCMVVVNLLNRSEMQAEANKAYDQLNQACNARLKDIKQEFKSAAGRALKTKEILEQCSQTVELINMSSHSPKGTALVRNIYSFEIS